jgi:hypothetical protein
MLLDFIVNKKQGLYIQDTRGLNGLRVDKAVTKGRASGGICAKAMDASAMRLTQRINSRRKQLLVWSAVYFLFEF